MQLQENGKIMLHEDANNPFLPIVFLHRKDILVNELLESKQETHLTLREENEEC